jgi:oxalate decarboxylase
MGTDEAARMQVDTPGGTIKVADSSNFPISTQFTGALVYFAPDGLRQFHWHLNFNEWQYVINGTLEVRRPLAVANKY